MLSEQFQEKCRDGQLPAGKSLSENAPLLNNRGLWRKQTMQERRYTWFFTETNTSLTRHTFRSRNELIPVSTFFRCCFPAEHLAGIFRHMTIPTDLHNWRVIPSVEAVEKRRLLYTPTIIVIHHHAPIFSTRTISSTCFQRCAVLCWYHWNERRRE